MVLEGSGVVVGVGLVTEAVVIVELAGVFGPFIAPVEAEATCGAA